MKTSEYHAEVWARLESMARAGKAVDSQDSASEAYARWLERGAPGETIEESTRLAAQGSAGKRLATVQDRADKRRGVQFLDMTTEGFTGPDRRHALGRFPQPPEVWTGLESLSGERRRELATIGAMEGIGIVETWLAACGVSGPAEPTIVQTPRSAKGGRPRGECPERRAINRQRSIDRKRAARVAARMAREASKAHAAQ
jgi:hypothetical protein